MTIAVKWSRTNDFAGGSATVPHLGTPGANAYDLYAADTLTLWPLRRQAMIRVGMRVEIPPGVAMLILPRSGLAVKQRLAIPNSPALIDSDYRGEILVTLRLMRWGKFDIFPGDRIGQAMFINTLSVDWIETDTLSETERGAGGFGSTGIRR